MIKTYVQLWDKFRKKTEVLSITIIFNRAQIKLKSAVQDLNQIVVGYIFLCQNIIKTSTVYLLSKKELVSLRVKFHNY